MPSTPKTRNTRLIARSLDLLAIMACFGSSGELATLMHRRGLFEWPEPQAGDIAGWPSHYAVLLIASLSLWAAVSGCMRVYQPASNAITGLSLRQLFRAIGLWLGIITFLIFVLKLRNLSRQFTITFLTLASFSILLRYFGLKHALNSRFRRRTPERNAIVIGGTAAAAGLAKLLNRLHAYDSIAFADRAGDASASAATDRSSSFSAAANSPTDFFLLSDNGTPITQDIILQLLKQRRIVHIVPGLIDAALFRYSITEIAGVPIITLSAGRLSPWQTASKRLLDILVAACVLLICAPLILIVAAAVRLTSRGPIFFRQERLGKDGRRFRIFKFRTMRADAEALLRADAQLYTKYRDNNFKLSRQEDFRVTSLGRLLRCSSLDELPQLLNVLRGDMSMVGPRPVVPEEISRYDDYAKLLLSVKPGITGYWQVNGRSLISDYAARVRLDMEYIRDQSLRADLQIIFKTVTAVARMEGAH